MYLLRFPITKVMTSGITRIAGFGFEYLELSVASIKQNQNPGVAPPDGAKLFYWPKRVCRKGPALRWACLAREGGNFNSDFSDRSKVYTSPAESEALLSLS
jgi:hypothetical protein